VTVVEALEADGHRVDRRGCSLRVPARCDGDAGGQKWV